MNLFEENRRNWHEKKNGDSDCLIGMDSDVIRQEPVRGVAGILLSFKTSI